MELNKLYESILRFAGMQVDNDGLVYLQAGEERRPALMGGNRLVLPLDSVLRAPPSTDRVIFHPLSENTLLGESEIISHLVKALNIKLNMTFGIVGQHLLSLCASPDQHKLLNPDQAELLIQIKDVDETTVTSFVNMLINAVSVDNENIYSNIYLRRGGVINGKKYARAGFTKFKMYEELQKDPTDLYGSKLRVKDRAAFKALHEFIYPGLNEKHAYDAGSQSQIAPFLDALMKTAVTMASRLNDLIFQYGDFIDNSEELIFDAAWVSVFEDLDVMRSEIRRIPSQIGNEGRVAPTQAAVNLKPADLQADRDRANLTIPGAITRNDPPPVQNTTTGQQWPTVNKTQPATVQPAVVANNNGPAAFPVPNQPVVNQYNQPQQPVNQNQQYQAQPVMTKNGLSYEAMMMNNPQLRPPMPMFNNGMMPQMNQPLLLPAWAGSMPQANPMFDQFGRPIMMQQPQMMPQQFGNQMFGQQQQQFQSAPFPIRV